MPFENDFVSYGIKWAEHKNFIRVCEPLKAGARCLLEDIGFLADSFIFHLHLKELSSSIGEKDVEFKGFQPSEKCNKVLNHVHVLTTLEKRRIPNAPGARSAEALIQAMLKEGNAVLSRLQTLTLSLHYTKYPDRKKIIEEWTCSEDSETVLDDWKQTARSLGVMNMTEEAEALKSLMADITAAETKLNQNLTASELVGKNAVLETLHALTEAFPVMTLEQIRSSSMEVLTAEILSKKQLGELSKKFFQALQSCDLPSEKLGKSLAMDIEMAREMTKLCLGVQSAFQVLKLQDAQKADAFEKARLAPHKMSLTDLPVVLVEDLKKLANSKGAVAAAGSKPSSSSSSAKSNKAKWLLFIEASSHAHVVLFGVAM